MSKESDFFIRVLRDHLAGRMTENIGDDLDWDILMRLIKNQNLEGIFYLQIRNALPKIEEHHPKVQNLSKKYALTLRYAVEREAFLAEFDEVMVKNRIRYLTFKGVEIAKCYPVAQLRTMGDLDILVLLEDKEKVDRILTGLGWRTNFGGMNEWFYEKTSGNGADVRVDIELHHNLMYDEPGCTKEQHAFLDSLWESAQPIGAMRYRLDDTFHLTYLILHLRKHFLNIGVGFRQFMDITVFARAKEIDWEQFALNVKRLGVEKFTSICFALISEWFGVDLPFAQAVLDRAMIDEATERILKNGVFGFQNRENDANRSIEQVFNRKDNARQKKSLLIIRELFPPLREMQMRKRYAFLKKYPFLLPATWGYRLIRSALRLEAGRHARKLGQIAAVKQGQIEKRQNELDKWGL